MAKNDRIILDELIAEAARGKGGSNDGAFFQTYALGQLLKDLELSSDEIELGVVDGRDDGGIDAWYTLLDGEVLTDVADISIKRVTSKIDLLIFTCKHHDTYRLDPLLSLHTAILELLDLEREEADLARAYNEDLLAARSLFKDALVRTARFNPKLTFSFCYVSRGDAQVVGTALSVRATALVTAIGELFSNSSTTFSFVGAAEILEAQRRIKDFSAALKFEEGPISRGATNYLGLATIDEYFRFITDDAGNLRRYLFESNVRDYMGPNLVNSSITQTLRTARPAVEEDFWWLNNGITVIATQANVIGKELHLQNVQLVNGLQTTETIFAYRCANANSVDDRCVLIKILVTPKKELADRIILATNNQTKVDLASLRATDKIQRDIEDLLGLANWYYDRRKNYYQNQGKPTNRIVSMKYLVWAVLAVRLKEPSKSNRALPKYMHVDAQYRRIFDHRADINVFLAVIELCKAIEATMLQDNPPWQAISHRNYVTLYRFLYAALYVAGMTRSIHCSDGALIALSKQPIDTGVLAEVHRIVRDLSTRYRVEKGITRRLRRNAAFQDDALREAVRIRDPASHAG